MSLNTFLIPLILLLSLVSFSSQATIDAYQFEDPQKEALYKKLVKDLFIVLNG